MRIRIPAATDETSGDIARAGRERVFTREAGSGQVPSLEMGNRQKLARFVGYPRPTVP